VANTKESLNLYAKVEDLLENSEAIEKLYGYYYEFLDSIEFRTLLDIGCGSGAFLSQINQNYKPFLAKGIDLSSVMVQKARLKGVMAEAVDLCELNGKFDVMSAVFDMLNYLPPQALKGFFECVSEHLNDDGYFVFDINTDFGFANVAVGAYIVEDEHRFLAIDSDYEDGVYEATFTLFEQDNELYRKMQESITQYYHSIDTITQATSMNLVVIQEISLYDMEQSDKILLVFQK
jgi:predicted TPR repeat methyltransferase